MTVSARANLQLVYVSDIERSTAFYKTNFRPAAKHYLPFGLAVESRMRRHRGTLKSASCCQPMKMSIASMRNGEKTLTSRLSVSHTPKFLAALSLSQIPMVILFVYAWQINPHAHSGGVLWRVRVSGADHGTR